jgi:hypothetical protein
MFVTIKRVTSSNVLKRVRREKVAAVKAAIMTKSGPKMSLLVPQEYAKKLVQYYESAKLNSQERPT